ncbi:hypothetical protein SSX86_029447 [Deinandra increscens subsp. villosa]|uniref:Uncharacterized protein n=1 Tax=Deinandra increscens subsp. villosa TaxID=3103831 RepID=A0AAP0CEU4_9ASTR
MSTCLGKSQRNAFVAERLLVLQMYELYHSDSSTKKTEMNGGGERRKTATLLPNRSKDKDEDLLLFRDMHKRDKNRVVSLLQPVSDEFEPNGNYPNYGMASAKKGPGFGFVGESEKNDYDWLKTPPATPLFPSLEMETRNAQELVVQRELPITQPLSRFAGKSEEKETKQINIGSNAGKPKTSNPKPRIPTRSVTPSGRSSSLFIDPKKNIKTAPISLIPSVNKPSVNELTNKPNTTPSVSKPLSERDNRFNLVGLNQSRITQKTRGVSPHKTSRITQLPGFSNETPPNLRTDRSISASRGRAVNQPAQNNVTAASQKPEVSSMRGRRQSCSPSVTRGRKVAPTSEENMITINPQKGSSTKFNTGNGGQFLGSRMVDKIMNARKSGSEEKKLNSSMNEGSGFGRITSQGSQDMVSIHRLFII